MSNLVLNKLSTPKYSNLGSPVVTIFINGFKVKNSLVDLGESINVMTREFLSHLNIIGIRETPTILQVANSSTIKPDGMIEDVIVRLDS